MTNQYGRYGTFNIAANSPAYFHVTGAGGGGSSVYGNGYVTHSGTTLAETSGYVANTYPNYHGSPVQHSTLSNTAFTYPNDTQQTLSIMR